MGAADCPCCSGGVSNLPPGICWCAALMGPAGAARCLAAGVRGLCWAPDPCTVTALSTLWSDSADSAVPEDSVREASDGQRLQAF